MSRHMRITDRILTHLRRFPECELEELVFSCREFTWHDTLIELVRMNRNGKVGMRTYSRGSCFIVETDIAKSSG